MSFSTQTRGRRLLQVSVAGLVLALVTLAAGLTAGEATGRSAKLLGTTGSNPKPSCPGPKSDSYPSHKACNVYGHVTGFQISAGSKKAIYKAKQSGRIVAWSVDISRLRKEERAVFEQKLPDDTFNRYGSKPTAGISVLKKAGKGRFKLTKRSPIVELDGLLGEQPVFTLQKPLRVKKGRIVALTTPTWLTNFALANPGGKGALSENYRWRASRKSNRCLATRNDDGSINDSNLTSRSHPHTRKGTTKRYGCVYSRAQIMYWAYLVPDKKGK
jgi:hypothetical protein